MIRFVTTAAHDYTVNSLSSGFGMPVPPTMAVTYPELFAAESIPPGTYVFTDLERLSHYELLLAADLYRCVASAGHCLALNDPARVRVRYGLLRRLKEAGFNEFDAYRADGVPRPSRFPVFVRRLADHDAAMSGLLPDQAALERKLERLESQGESLRGLVVIEFCAEPVAPGIYRRYGMFRIGGRMHLDHIVTEDSWNVKYGKVGLATEEMYRADHLAIRENAFAEEVSRAFDLACIDYGRADFGIVGGRPQLYEINTNPFLARLKPHPSPIRTASNYLAHARFAELLHGIDRPGDGPPVVLDGPRLVECRKARAWERGLPPSLLEEVRTIRPARDRLEAELREIRQSLLWRAVGPVHEGIRLARRAIARLRARFSA